jgi:hypothetical protein
LSFSAGIKQTMMSASAERPIPTVLTPWVFVLVALIGLNAVTQDYSRARRNDSNGKAGISQPAEIPNSLGNFTSPLVFLIPHSIHRAAILVSLVLSVELTREEPLSDFPQGAVRGRAPPTGLLS